MNVNIWFVNERIMLCLERCLCVAEGDAAPWEGRIGASPPSATNCTNQRINVNCTIKTLTPITRLKH